MEHCRECGNTADHLLGCERAKCPVAAYHAKLEGQRSDDKKERVFHQRFMPNKPVDRTEPTIPDWYGFLGKHEARGYEPISEEL